MVQAAIGWSCNLTSATPAVSLLLLQYCRRQSVRPTDLIQTHSVYIPSFSWRCCWRGGNHDARRLQDSLDKSHSDRLPVRLSACLSHSHTHIHKYIIWLDLTNLLLTTDKQMLYLDDMPELNWKSGHVSGCSQNVWPKRESGRNPWAIWPTDLKLNLKNWPNCEDSTKKYHYSIDKDYDCK